MVKIINAQHIHGGRTMSQISLKQVPENIDILIRSISKKQNKSIDRTVISLLEKALEIKDDSNKKRDLSSLAGTWSKSQFEEFERNTALFGKIDREIWE
jgi:hypothetical protein